jgi:hypothetical protein
MSNSTEQKFKVGDTIFVPAVIIEVDIDSPEYKLSLLNGDFLWATKETLSQYSSTTLSEPEPSRAMIAAMCLQGFIANGEWDGNVIEVAVQYADELLAELQNQKP